VCAVFAPAVVKHVEKSANAIMQANEKNFVDSVLEKPESKFYLSAELTKGFLDGMTLAKNAGIRSAELRGLIGGFFNCENEFDIGGLRTQRSAFNVNAALHCQDILPIKELVVKKRPGGIVALYTDKAYQDMQDQSAVELGLKIYTAYLTAYSARFNRDQLGTTNTADMQNLKPF
jgi:hypothetical protein